MSVAAVLYGHSGGQSGTLSPWLRDRRKRRGKERKEKEERGKEGGVGVHKFISVCVYLVEEPVVSAGKGEGRRERKREERKEERGEEGWRRGGVTYLVEEPVVSAGWTGPLRAATVLIEAGSPSQ